MELKTSVSSLCQIRGVDLGTLAAAIGESPDDLTVAMADPSMMTLPMLGRISGYFDVNVDALLSGQVDLDWAKSRMRGEDALPEFYRRGAGSFVRTSLPIVSHVRSHWGEPLFRYLYRQLKVSPRLFSEPEQRVSIYFLRDVLRTLHNRGFDEAAIRRMGVDVATLPENWVIKSAYSGARGVHEVFERLCDEIIHLYEKNFSYILLKMRPRGFVMKVAARRDMQDALGAAVIDSRLVCQYRQGVLEAHPSYVGLSRIRCREKACVHLGDAACLYEFSW